ncbi:glutathione S-transferase T2-like [Camellia sinensis]|uniref:glutathione S-transferase T2-like n=1 Tax=Camellia sinensis TaxID=4442 RepID=UPI0010357AAE|nr:glutathione S-transferase T2-like [Camellia sinensis]
MDSQQDGYFTNLLQEMPNIDEHYLMESQYLNQSTQVFAQECAVHGNEQKRSTYWKRVWDFFHKHKKFESNRNENSLINQWSAIQLPMNKLCGCYTQIESLHQSGINEDDKICKAKIMYKELKKSTFQFEHCWIMLRDQPKWVIESEKKKQPKRPRTGTTSSPCTPDSINLGEDDVSPNDFVDLERPTGRKAEKERLNKRKNQESVQSSITKTLEDIKQDKKKMIDKKIEMIDKVYVQKEVELRIMQEKHEMELQKHEMELFKEDERVILMDLTGLPEIQQEFYRARQMEIIKKRRTK